MNKFYGNLFKYVGTAIDYVLEFLSGCSVY